MAHIPLRPLSPNYFFQNYVPGLQDYTWSLAVEEHFYVGSICIAQ